MNILKGTNAGNPVNNELITHEKIDEIARRYCTLPASVKTEAIQIAYVHEGHEVLRSPNIGFWYSLKLETLQKIDQFIREHTIGENFQADSILQCSNDEEKMDKSVNLLDLEVEKRVIVNGPLMSTPKSENHLQKSASDPDKENSNPAAPAARSQQIVAEFSSSSQQISILSSVIGKKEGRINCNNLIIIYY